MHKKKFILPIFLSMIGVLSIGIGIFLSIQPKSSVKTNKWEEEVSLSDPLVKKLYEPFLSDIINTSCLAEGKAFVEFLKQETITKDTLDENIKLKMALSQLSQEDFQITSKTTMDPTTQKEVKIYTIRMESLQSKIREIFGPDSTISYPKKAIPVYLPFALQIDPNEEIIQNTALLYYNKDQNQMELQMTPETVETCSPYDKIAKVHTMLVSAGKQQNKFILEAAFLYTKVEVEIAKNYQIAMYQDKDLLHMIDSASIKEQELEQFQIEDYYKKAPHILYVFQKNVDGTYFFDHSEIQK